ncbi:hypothetical protein EZS27_027706, partial [termite gut metagenome]
MNNTFEQIIPWNGEADTGKDVRLKWQRNFEKIRNNFNEVGLQIQNLDDLIFMVADALEKYAIEAEKKYLRKDIEDTAKKLIYFLSGIDVEGETATDGLLVRENAFFNSTLSGKEFTSGFLSGKSWSIFLKDFLNAAGGTEKKAGMELDEITVRGAMRVYELIISQLRGENGTHVITDMMRVTRIDRQEKKIYLDTEKGVLYNPFRAGDLLMVQRFGGLSEGNNIVKQYELLVTDVGIGSAGENREDWIIYSNFTGNTDDVSARDVLTRIDSLTDLDRKGIIKETSVEPGSPYLDVLYGTKTDPENALRLRLGRLTGIITYLWGQLNGYGLYSNNVYLTGNFRLNNGEDVRTRFEVIEGMFQSAMQSITNTLTDEDNFLTNAVFKDNMACWERENNIKLFSVVGVPLDLVSGFYSIKNTIADVASYDGRFMLRLKKNTILQRNLFIKKPEADSILYLTIRYHCQEAGQLTAGFYGKELYLNKPIPAGEGYHTIETSATWNGTGDFTLGFTGDIYIEQLTLYNHPLDDYKKEVYSLFEQTDTRILAVVGSIETLGNRVTSNESSLTITAQAVSAVAVRVTTTENSITGIQSTIATAGWITTADGNQLWAKHETVNALGNRVTTVESSLTVNANAIIAVATRMNTAENSIISIHNTINTAGWITTADGNQLWAKHETVNALGNRVTSVESSLTVNANAISAVVMRVNTTEGDISSIKNTISSAGWITTSSGNQLWAKKSLENGSEIISLINQDAGSITIDASKINLSGNVVINGTIRNAFVKNDSTIYIGGTDPQLNLKQHDHVVAIQNGSWRTTIDLPWTLEHSGRRVCIVNYKWGTTVTGGIMDITAPSGKYFYEDGRSKSSLSFSREVVELLGYGDNATFFGWIVVN